MQLFPGDWKEPSLSLLVAVAVLLYGTFLGALAFIGKREADRRRRQKQSGARPVKPAPKLDTREQESDRVYDESIRNLTDWALYAAIAAGSAWSVWKVAMGEGSLILPYLLLVAMAIMGIARFMPIVLIYLGGS